MDLRIYDKLADIPKEQWNELQHGSFPFSDYRFLETLEGAKCVGPKTGWRPIYLTVWSGDLMTGATYLYLKEHSYGEYIFDWQWAQAYKNYGIPYYPKLLSAVPFTPATGPKLLINKNHQDPLAVKNKLLSASIEHMRDFGCSTFNALFIDREDIELYRAQGLLIRYSFQYHWTNKGYKTFEDFLESLKGEKRRKIAKERRDVRAHGLTFETITGEALRPMHAEAMSIFYRSTIAKMQGIPYLTDDFFPTIFGLLADRIVLCTARNETEIVAAAINFRQNDKLFGRYWGCKDNYTFLHFELCYYQTVSYAIATGVTLFEAGAQGEHKLQRGFLPSYTYSAHLLEDSRFHQAINNYVVEEEIGLKAEIERSKSHFPFK
ncbi:MAG: GNAT family N-acetyltransferase [Proteobacteria bacterium]|nr:GNAT family N-acetyltransferase [Pseudomonadota bacterium]